MQNASLGRKKSNPRTSDDITRRGVGKPRGHYVFETTATSEEATSGHYMYPC